MRNWGLGMLAALALSLTACSKDPKIVVLPDSHDLRPAVICPQGVTCAEDPGRWTIDKGYLREILFELERAGAGPRGTR